jgi:hypothetical protein
MELVPGFAAMLQAIRPTMTAPTFDNFLTIVTGWLFAGRRVLTRVILAAGYVVVCACLVVVRQGRPSPLPAAHLCLVHA